MKTISTVTPPDNPGVAVLPPVLYGGAFLIVLVLHFFWPLRITRPSVAVPLGLLVVLAALGRAVADSLVDSQNSRHLRDLKLAGGASHSKIVAQCGKYIQGCRSEWESTVLGRCATLNTVSARCFVIRPHPCIAKRSHFCFSLPLFRNTHYGFDQHELLIRTFAWPTLTSTSTIRTARPSQ